MTKFNNARNYRIMLPLQKMKVSESKEEDNQLDINNVKKGILVAALKIVKIVKMIHQEKKAINNQVSKKINQKILQRLFLHRVLI